MKRTVVFLILFLTLALLVVVCHGQFVQVVTSRPHPTPGIAETSILCSSATTDLGEGSCPATEFGQHIILGDGR